MRIRIHKAPSKNLGGENLANRIHYLAHVQLQLVLQAIDVRHSHSAGYVFHHQQSGSAKAPINSRYVSHPPLEMFGCFIENMVSDPLSIRPFVVKARFQFNLIRDVLGCE